MLRVLFFIFAVAVFGIGFAWIADTPGTIVMTVAGREITVTLMVAAGEGLTLLPALVRRVLERAR